MVISVLLRDARMQAGLSQRELARLARTSQPAVARYEGGSVVPDLDTLRRLLHACGRQLEISAPLMDPVMVRQVSESLALTPARRVARNRAAIALAARAAAARRAGRVRPLRPGPVGG